MKISLSFVSSLYHCWKHLIRDNKMSSFHQSFCPVSLPFRADYSYESEEGQDRNIKPNHALSGCNKTVCKPDSTCKRNRRKPFLVGKHSTEKDSKFLAPSSQLHVLPKGSTDDNSSNLSFFPWGVYKYRILLLLAYGL